MEHYVQKTAKVLKDFKQKVLSSSSHKHVIGKKIIHQSEESKSSSADEEQNPHTTQKHSFASSSSIKMYLKDDSQVFSPFYRAIIEGKLELVSKMIASGDEDVNSISKSGVLPLKTSLQYHQYQIANLLVKSGASIDFKITHKEQNLLCFAAENGFNHLLKSLLDREIIDVNERDSLGYSPLFYAVKNGDVCAVRMLAEKSDVNALYDWNATVLWKAASSGNLKIVEILLENGADASIDHKDDYGNSALSRALQQKHWDVVQCMIKSGAATSLDELSEIDGRTMLHICCEENGLDDLYLSIIDNFRSNKELWARIEPEIIDLAKQHNKICILEDLYKDKHLFDDEGHHILAANEAISGLSMLYKSVGWDISIKDARTGININMVNGRGNTLLYELVEHVRTRDADLIAKHKNIISLITEHGADVNYTARSNGWSPLHIAVSSKQPVVIEILIKHNADYLLKDIHGRTPFDIAVLNEYTEILQSKTLIDQIIGDMPIAVEVEGITQKAKRSIEEIVYLKKLQLLAEERGCEYTVDYCIKRLIEHKKVFKEKYPAVKLKDILSTFPEFKTVSDDSSFSEKEEKQMDISSTTVTNTDDVSEVVPSFDKEPDIGMTGEFSEFGIHAE